MKKKGLAAITLSHTEGGVAAVSRLLWRVYRERWPNESCLITLNGEDAPVPVGVGSWPSRLVFGARLARLQAIQACESVCYSHLSAALVQSYVPRMLQRPYAVFLHGIEAWRQLGPRRRRVLEKATLLLANSSYTARRVADTHPWIGHITACGLALDDEMAAPQSERRSHPPRLDVLIVGRMSSAEQYKGHDQLLEAWPRVRTRVPEARLLIAGSGDDEERLKGKARDLGLGAAVVFSGFLSTEGLREAYREAAVFAMPSRNEGFGLVYLEAMAQRLPCIGSVHDAAGEVIEDGVTGYLVDQADTSGLADRLVALLLDENRRRQMGGAGLDRLQKHFSYDRFRDRLLALVEDRFGPQESAVSSASSPARLPQAVNPVRK